MRRTSLKEKGITLVALVVTIIVLLILAGITINMAISNNGIMQRAKDAKEETEIAQEKEILSLAATSAMCNNPNYTVEKQYLDEELNKTPGRDKYSSNNTKSGIQVTFLTSGRTYVVNTGGNITNYSKPKETGIYAKLYTDGTLIVSSKDYTDTARTVEKDFNIIKNKASNSHWSVSSYNSKVQNVIIYDDIVPTSTASWFYGLSNLTNIENIENLNTSLVTNMQDMFNNCKKLTNLVLSSFDTESVINMTGMFSGCRGLTTLDLSNFDTSEVTSMGAMFKECSGLTSLDLTNFNTSRVTSMSSMFEDCGRLTSLDLSSFDTSKVTSMGAMFKECGGLTSLDLTNFNTSRVTSMSSMFDYCSGLTNLNLSSFDTSSVTSMQCMFKNCMKLLSLDLTKFNTSNVIDMDEMFKNVEMENLDLSKFDTNRVERMRWMFSDCSRTKTIYVGEGWNLSSLSQSNSMFKNCNNLTGQNGTRFDSTHTDATYACVDSSETPGYLTYKASQ